MKYMNNRHLKTEKFTRKISRKPIFKTSMSKMKMLITFISLSHKSLLFQSQFIFD